MKDTEAKKGMKFNYLTMISDSYTKNRRRYAMFKCVCGKEKEIRVSCVVDMGTKSCGCMKKHLMAENNNHFKHGLCHSRICQIWYKMRQRCQNPNYCEFYLYGGRGISVCDEWDKDFEVFYEWAMEHGYSDDLSIDRIDVNGNYEPSNCRWADMSTQRRNQRRCLTCDM